MNQRIQEAFDQIKSIPTDTRIFNYGNSESPALVNKYHEQLGGQFIPAPAAKDWWYGTYPEIDKMYRKSQTPEPGAIFVGLYGPYHDLYGHMGIVLEVDWDNIHTIEQNGGRGPGVSKYVRTQRWIHGYLIPRETPLDQTEYGTFEI